MRRLGCPLSQGASGFAQPEPIGVTPLDVGPSPSELWWTPAGRRPNALPICRILGWLAPSASGERHKLGRTSTGRWMQVLWESLSEVASLVRVRSTGGELPERCKITRKAPSSLTPPESATRSERFLNLTEVPPVPERVYRFLAGLASFLSRPGYFYPLFLNVTEALVLVFS